MLVVRLNQLGAGGSGVDPALLPVLADAINRGFTPPVPLYGAIGTGDLTALASTGLCLLGERAWHGGTGPPPRLRIRTSEALGFINSSAATLGDAALACHDLAGLLRCAAPVAALSLHAVHGSAEPYAEAVQLARPHPASSWSRAACGRCWRRRRTAPRGCRIRTDTGHFPRSTAPHWTVPSTRTRCCGPS
jgi:histidine ammonia-lyase